jgi:FKBP-type peptidyl-prolyl cis-trans isomerase
VIPGFEEAVSTMKEGGIRRVVVPLELGYPENDMYKKGPTPTTFSVSLLCRLCMAKPVLKHMQT